MTDPNWSQISLRTGLLDKIKDLLPNMPDITNPSHYIEIAVRYKIDRDYDQLERKGASPANGKSKSAEGIQTRSPVNLARSA